MHRTDPSQLDGGQAYTLGLQRVMAEKLNVTVDAAARADTERAEEAARAHVSAANSARNSAGGRAAMAGPHAHAISSAGGRGHLGKIYHKPGQTAKQQAGAEKKRKERAAKRAAEAEGQ